MGIKERKEREREERKEVIRSRAKDIIHEEGMKGASLKRIAEAADVSTSGIAYYFGSKEGLLIDILERSVDAFYRHAKTRMDGTERGIDSLRTLWSSFMEFFIESNDISILVGIRNYVDFRFPHEIASSTNRHPKAALKVCGLIEETLGRGILDGSVDSRLKPADAARTLFLVTVSTLDSAIRFSRERRSIDPAAEELRRLYELIVPGLAADGIRVPPLDPGAEQR